jgi:membrane-bound lytic murein transglycosylase B
MMIRLVFFLSLPACLSPAHAVDLPGIPQFIDEMVDKDHYDRKSLALAFRHARLKPGIINAMSAPAAARPWPQYRDAFVTPRRIREGLQFWKLHANALRHAEERYGVPQEIIVALLGVETQYGRNMGKFRVLDALTTLAFDYPRRAPFFRSELEQYFLLAREQRFNLYRMKGSYAGAMGIPQFMPDSYRKYAVDFDHDGKINLLKDPVDAIGSVANYLKEYGWAKDAPVAVRATVGENCLGSLVDPHSIAEWQAAGVEPREKTDPAALVRLKTFTTPDGPEFWIAYNNFDVITRYNNSDYYAMSVFLLAQRLHEAHAGAAIAMNRGR